jgi:ParB family transcriptional regulator, chromosome partitioning protein
MPSIDSIKRDTRRKFKKREYRPWDINGTKSNNDEENASISQSTPHSNNENLILEIPTIEIKNWKFHDRPENELGNIQDLAREFVEIGQQQPCTVRPIEGDPIYKYELIVGERRWRAAQLADIKLKVVVKKISNSTAAIIQSTENSSRKDLSDYAKGMSYSQLISNDVISRNELMEQLNIKKQHMSRLLSFAKIPQVIKDSIPNMSRISAGTAEKIVQLSAKGEKYIEAILFLKEKIEEGELGHAKLSALVDRAIKDKKEYKNSKERVCSDNGKHLFTWRTDNNNLPSIHFPKDVLKTLNKEEFTGHLKKLVNEILIKGKSPTGGTNYENP